ncbi:MAG: DUF5615 family PIN-like protein [Acidobacteriia bacterium]|nr:DUF5615 family PIN-like protein [Terriglobia bacterium]
MKFLVDMALSPDLAIWLRSQGHDAVHASDLALHRAADTQILSIALDSKRVLISADLDFPRLLALAGAAGPGLILLRSGKHSEAESLECVRRVLMSVAAEDLPRSIVVVDHKSVWRRLLPIQILPDFWDRRVFVVTDPARGAKQRLSPSSASSARSRAPTLISTKW